MSALALCEMPSYSGTFFSAASYRRKHDGIFPKSQNIIVGIRSGVCFNSPSQNRRLVGMRPRWARSAFDSVCLSVCLSRVFVSLIGRRKGSGTGVHEGCIRYGFGCVCFVWGCWRVFTRWSDRTTHLRRPVTGVVSGGRCWGQPGSL